MPRPYRLISQQGRGDLHRSPVNAPCRLACSSLCKNHSHLQPSSSPTVQELSCIPRRRLLLNVASPHLHTESRKLPANPHLAGYQGEVVCHARARQMSLHAHVCMYVSWRRTYIVHARFTCWYLLRVPYVTKSFMPQRPVRLLAHILTRAYAAQSLRFN
jgi:hypothetical protein